MSELDPEKCKEIVRRGETWHRYNSQCNFKIWKDGYCKMHHPDSVAERERKSKERYDERWKQTAICKLSEARKRIKELEAEIARLKS